MSIPAAWYPDPQDAARVRWWDGAGWTETTQPDPALVGQPGVTPPPPPITAPIGAPPAFTEQLTGQQLFGTPIPDSLFGVPVKPAPPESPWVNQNSQSLFEAPGYVPMGAMAQGRPPESQYMPQHQRAGTPAIWLYIFLPIINVVVVFIVTFVAVFAIGSNGENPSTIRATITQWTSLASIVDLVAFIIVSVVIAHSDSRTLKQHGFFDAPSGWFMLIQPVYMILRTIKTGAVRYLLWWILWWFVLPGGISAIVYIFAFAYLRTQIGL